MAIETCFIPYPLSHDCDRKVRNYFTLCARMARMQECGRRIPDLDFQAERYEMFVRQHRPEQQEVLRRVCAVEVGGRRIRVKEGDGEVLIPFNNKVL